jgi:hypothetical protein
VALASIYGLIKWLYYFTVDARTNFICRFLNANEIRYQSSSSLLSADMNSSLDHDDRMPMKRLEEFVENYCRQDGLLLLRLMKKNTNNVIAGELICALWDHWKDLPHIRFNASSDSDNGGQIIGLGVKNPLKQIRGAEVNEKLLSSI